MPDPGNLHPHKEVNPRVDLDFYSATLEDIENLLNQEDAEEDESTRCAHNPLALQAMETSFYQVLDHVKDFPTPSEYTSGFRCPYSLSGSEDYGCSVRNAISSLVEPSRSFNPMLLVDSFPGSEFAINARRWSESYLSYSRGANELHKFLPGERDEGQCSSTGGRVKTSHLIGIDEGMQEKLLTACDKEDDEIYGMFDRLFLENIDDRKALVIAGSSKQGRAKKRKNEAASPDFGVLLYSCAQAIWNNDFSVANKLLKQIQAQSSAFGNGPQRCAHFFSNALEARMAFGVTQCNHTLNMQSLSATAVVKSYKAFSCAIPFMKINFYLLMHHISNLVERTRETLHIIHFGIFCGFRWVKLIEDLSAKSGGPPKLRMTYIEDCPPKIGLAEMIEKVGQRLAKYCKRFNVPFEHDGIIARNWEIIRIEDLKIEPNETIVVICMLQFDKLHEEDYDDVQSPRTLVLDLVQRINPDIFFHSIVNASYGNPFFTIRLREAFYYFSSLFDMFHSVLTPESQERLFIEKYNCGRILLNVLACEGLERVERPERYKVWQERIEKAGFRSLPLDMKLMRELREMVRSEYDKNFLIEEDGHWLLKGWRGRALRATCCWAPALQS